jgi:hypothetical protein
MVVAAVVLQSSKSAPNIVSDWGATKAATEQTMKLMQMYKDLGDFEGQVLTTATMGSSAAAANSQQLGAHPAAAHAATSSRSCAGKEFRGWALPSSNATTSKHMVVLYKQSAVHCFSPRSKVSIASEPAAVAVLLGMLHACLRV